MSEAIFSIRPETTADYSAVFSVESAAFGRTDEADLVDRLRDDGDDFLSLVATADDVVIGHIFFTPLMVADAVGPFQAVALAPVAVMPRWQGRGVGQALIETGLDLCRRKAISVVFVLGDPAYYCRFGFSADYAAAFAAPFEGEAFMALDLRDQPAEPVTGRVRYAEAFGIDHNRA